MSCINPSRCTLTVCCGESCAFFIKVAAYPMIPSMVPTRSAFINEFTTDELLAEIKRRMGM